MKFLVQKFGGTSVATPQGREMVAAKVVAAKEEGYMPVVVVSAMGRNGDPYATDTLINMVKQINRNVSPREMDLLMSCGEIISGVVMVATLEKMGYPAVFLTGAQAGIITDNSFSEARILRVKPEAVLKYAREGKIVVVAGFQGISEEGEITTLGRGGSDTTAAALGVALNADYVDIYTDVDGIMTADPRIVSDAVAREMVTYDEICQLAHEGAKVVHPRAVEIVMQKNIPLRVKSTFSDAPGTLVTSSGEVYKGTIDITRDRTITGITQIPNVVQFKVNTSGGPEGLKEQRRLFKGLALAGISLDFINVYPDQVVFTVKEEVAEKAAQVLENTGFVAEIIPGCAKVAAVGAGMTGVPGVMASIVDALTRENIPILQSSDSHTTIWVLVRQEDMERAVRALHRQFISGAR
ncbi:aspartate kinase [Desulfofundulus thermosubterraneus]|uniref:Aspartokinase n=1 Tax=Desulfofundulus thermosubterraneus DSM 16057 TaxID=1121432 RepID=A0A1M6B6H7_9FIRM|nr:aspartate kinase [Desulfofundulus thermosubterraneus]SHI44341.1 aspartate kinase [Desulfofundulus thermosubterraneus DSM 16057]